MAATYTSTFKIKRLVAGANTLDLATNSATLNDTISRAYTAGSGSGNIDTALTDDVTLGVGANTEYDLDAGTLTDMFGTAITIATVKMLFVYNDGDTNDLQVTGDFLGLSTDSVDITPGGVLYWDFGPAGRAVTAATADVIDVASSAGSSYQLVILAVKA